MIAVVVISVLMASTVYAKSFPDEPQTLTPEGNMTLVDDFSGESAEDKQFITVVTRNGHFFYIVIDRAGERKNVHFLNQVDEYDLWAVIEEEARPRPAPEPVSTPEPTPTPEPEPIPEPQQSNAGRIIIFLILLGAIGGGAYYYFTVLKPEHDENHNTTSEFDEFQFDGDDEDDSDDDIPDFTAKESEDE